MIENRYAERVRQLHEQLGIPEDYAQKSGLCLCAEPDELVLTELDHFGRKQRLTPAAFAAWQLMKQSASSEGVSLFLVSAFRSVDYQCQLIRRKLDSGQSIEQILRVNAAPGFSEHHSGCAIDICTPDSPVLEEDFEATPAYAWMQRRAGEFGFTLSYPRGNDRGILYEPWHWYFKHS
jgi:D-alanyl-D-alanine carboxypeptidase